MVFSIFQANKKAKSAEVNANFAFTSGGRLIAVNASTGAAIGTFPIGDLTAITNGSLAGDLLARTGNSLKVYNASGALIGSVSYDDMLNLQSASETHEGVVELATTAEVIAGTDSQRVITPAGLTAAFANSKTTNGYSYLPNGLIMQWGTDPTLKDFPSSATLTFPIAFPNAILNAQATLYGSAPDAMVYVSAVSTTQITLVYDEIASAQSAAGRYFVIGY